jgi:hypothetical protein
MRFRPDPEFPAGIDQPRLTADVPTMPEDIYGRLIARLELKGWTETELAIRVHPLPPRLHRSPSDYKQRRSSAARS